MRPAHVLLTALAAALALSSCSGGASADDAGSGDRVDVTAAFYPYQFVAERVGGDAVEVTNLTKPGGEPHDLELSPRQVGGLAETALVVYSAGFQPAVDEAVEQQAQDRALDVLTTVELRDAAPEQDHEDHAEDGTDEAHEEHADEGGADPHVWLDPARLATIGQAVADRLAEVDPDGAQGYRSRAAALTADLTALDEELRTGLASCARTRIVTSHGAFGYLADAYGLTQVSIAGLSPEAEASPQRFAELAEQAEADGTTTVFFEELVSPKVAQALAREVGAQAVVLSPLEGAPEQGDYLTAMRADLAALRTALDCT